jgi:chitin synthase
MALRNRAEPDKGIPPVTTPWPVKDMVYVAIIGSFMLAALLEWILWLLAFLYCLVKVYQKATGQGKWAIRTLCILNMIFFIGMRCVFLPIMVVTLPLPAQVVQYFPEQMVSVLQWFAFWSFAGLLTIPWLFCVYQLVTHDVGRHQKIKTVLDEYSAPKVVIIMPCYNEEPEILIRTIDSIVDCEYPPSCLHIFLSFDGDAENELYLRTIENLGVPLALDTFPTSIDVKYRKCRITVSRFPHGGKRSCQKKSFKLIDKVYAEYIRRNDDLFLLFIDSDCILDKYCIQNFMYEMELKPGSKHDVLAMTGVITSTTTKNTLLTVLQDMEYIHGQLFERSVESGCGAVTCLPGALTILRFSAFRKMAKYYFADKAEQCDDLFDYGKCHLGEDRWLTHLFMIGAQKRYQIQLNTGAFCKTEAVQTFKSLLKQRRRWFLGFITNEVCMLTDIRLWKRYPLLLLIRLAQNTIRTTALLFFIMILSLLTTSQKIANLPVGFIAVSLGLNWVLMLYFGAKLGRFKIMLYPLMFVVNPFFNWLYMVYGIFTAGQRTWGGPRADAGKADVKTTVSEIIAEAEAQGDELNVVPETFRPKKKQDPVPLLPSDHLVGRFAPASELPGGWFRQSTDSGVNLADMTPRQREAGRYHPAKDGRPPSDYSDHSPDRSRDSSCDGIATPRRVESIFGDEDAALYRDQQALHRPAGGAFLEDQDYPATTREAPGHQRFYSTASTASDSSVSMHYGFPSASHQAQFSDPDSLADTLVMPGSSNVGAGSASDQNFTAGSSGEEVAQENGRNTGRLSASSQTAQETAHQAPPRTPSRQRNYSKKIPQTPKTTAGRSPLARKSFTRLASDEIEMANRRSPTAIAAVQMASSAHPLPENAMNTGGPTEAEASGPAGDEVERGRGRSPRKLVKKRKERGSWSSSK